MSDALLRQWMMLKMIPRQPKKTNSRILTKQLQAEGFNTARRNTQRDLSNLSSIFPELVNDGNKDEIGWSWRQDAELHDMPSIDPSTALTFKLAQTFLINLIPPAVLTQLQPYFRSADKILSKIDNNSLGNWSDHVRIVARTQPLIPASINQTVLSVIYDALLQGQQFRGRYKNRQDDIAEYEFHPLGLIFRDSVVYLIATLWDYEDIRHFALHRFIQTEIMDTSLQRPDNFNLDDYIATGTTEYALPGDKNIKLVAYFSNTSIHHLTETPLSKDQRITPLDNDRKELRATVKDTYQLRWWLLGFGDQVEVVKPIALRREFAGIVREMYMTYTDE
ncbi:MAG: WYL domain-containing protein [Gammaproteobacteria bacterium]|nr:WYL domain-containing protein [Gammaproteobacteria bacterium]